VPELRDDPSLKDINDVATLAKTYKDTKAFVGSSIRPPGPDASPEAKKYRAGDVIVISAT